MKIQRSTGVLLGVAISLVATVAIIETTKKNRPESGDALYSFAEADVDAFTITRSDATLSFEKTDDTWQMTEPQDAPADPSAIAFLLNIITTDPIKETIVANADQLEQYGLDEPVATVELQVVGDEEHSLAVGDEDFSGSSLYVMTTEITAESEPGELYLMPKGLQTGIDRPVDDWIAADNDEEALDNSTDKSSESDNSAPPEATEADDSDSPEALENTDNNQEADNETVEESSTTESEQTNDKTDVDNSDGTEDSENAGE